MSPHLKAIADSLIVTVKGYVDRVAAGMTDRIKALEERAPVPGPKGDPGEKGLDGAAGRDGVDGKDAPAVDLEALAAKAAALVPAPKDGRDGKDFDPAQVDAAVQRAVDAIPRPADGKSVSIEDVAPLVRSEVSAQLSAAEASRRASASIDKAFSERVSKALGETVLIEAK